MAKSDYPNSGTLSRNERKNQPNHPDHRGEAHLNCPHCGKESDFWLSAWIKISGPSSKTPGNKFFSLAFKPKDANSAPAARANAPATATGELDDDIPF